MSLFGLISGIVRTQSCAAAPGRAFLIHSYFWVVVFVVSTQSRLLHQAFPHLSGSWSPIPCPSVLESWLSSPRSCPLQNLWGLPEPVSCREPGRLTSHCVQQAVMQVLTLCPQGLGLLTCLPGAQTWNSESEKSVMHKPDHPWWDRERLVFI